MNKVTKIMIRQFVKEKLSTDTVWAKKALIKIYEFQTLDEQKQRDTIYHNGVGFTGTDGRILTSFAKQLLKTGYLSDKQTELLMKKMPKYWIQVVKISDKEKLNSLINA
jgi:hypothetical protein